MGRSQSTQLSTMSAAVATQAGGVMAPVLVGALAVQLKDALEITDTYLGLVVSLYSLASGLAAASAGSYVDRRGARHAVRTAAVANALVLIAIGVFVRSPVLLAVGLATGGLTAAIAGPAANALLARQIPEGRRGLAFGLKQAAVPVTTFLAGLSIPVVAVNAGWPWVFVLSSIVPIAAGSLTRDTVMPEREDRATQATVNLRALRPLLVGGAAATFVATGLNTFFVASAVATGLTPGEAGLLVAGASVFGLAIRILSGWIVDRRGSDGLGGAAWLLLSGVAGFGLLALGEPALLLPAALLTYGGGWTWSGLYQHGVVFHHPQAPGRATGIIRIGLMTGGAAGPLTFGAISEGGDYGPAWMTLAGLSVVASVGFVIGATRLRKQPVNSRA